jgi:hypothetical protein
MHMASTHQSTIKASICRKYKGSTFIDLLYKKKLTLHVDEVFNAIKLLTIVFIHDSFLQFMDLAYACRNHPKRHFYFQRPIGRRQLDGMNLKLVQRIGSCKLFSKETSPHFC